jgi:hypothetical protein
MESIVNGYEEEEKKKKTHGGKRSKQGDIKQAFKDVKDPSKYPRLDGFFQRITPSFLRDKSSYGSTESLTSSAGSTKRLRTNQSADGPVTTFPPPIEPPDIAPAASSFLMGKGGIISQALSALRSGSYILPV